MPYATRRSCKLVLAALFTGSQASAADGDIVVQKLQDALKNPAGVYVPGRRRLTGTDDMVYADGAAEDATGNLCTPGQSCDGRGTIPNNRGICVQVGDGASARACWDVCNPAHANTDYWRISPNASVAGLRVPMYDPTRRAMAGLVAQVRAGMNSWVQCPGNLTHRDVCPPGELCPSAMADLFNVEPGRGMCVVNTSRRDNRACRDMCDFSYSPMSYAEGAAKGAARTVEQMRAGYSCPNPNAWMWLIPAVLLCLCCGAGCFALLGTRISDLIKNHRNGKSGKRSRASSLAGATSRGVDNGDEVEGYDEEGRYAPAVSEPGPEMQDRGIVIPDRPPSQDNIYAHTGPPPEPPQLHSSYREAPPPAPPPFPEDTHASTQQLFDQIDSNHDGVISRSEYEQFQRAASMGAVPPPPAAPGSVPSMGSMRIPGLDEPNLFSNLQPMVAPGSAPQLAPPSIEPLGLTTPFITPGSQPQAVFQVAPSYHTQIPPTFTTQIPAGPGSAPNSLQITPGAANSVQLAPGAVTAVTGNAGAPFFTQLMRR